MEILSFFALLALFAAGDAFREASDEEFPFQVSIQTTNKRHLCGGAIIAPKWVLTASSCLKHELSVFVSYGSVDSGIPKDSIASQRIEHQSSPILRAKNSLALIHLRRSVTFSKTAQQAKLPTSRVQLPNNTKLSGWRVNPMVDVPPNLYVSDSYLVVPKDCKKVTGEPVILAGDEFCGMDENFQNILFNPGSIVSKSATVLGILPSPPIAASEPYIYVKMSEHEEWVRDVLQSDAQFVNWENDVPKNSAPQHHGMSLALVGISAIFLRFFY